MNATFANLRTVSCANSVNFTLVFRTKSVRQKFFFEKFASSKCSIGHEQCKIDKQDGRMSSKIPQSSAQYPKTFLRRLFKRPKTWGLVE